MEKNILMIVEAFKIYFNHVVSTKQINLKEFVQFMEPKFAAAGYRTPPPRIHHTNFRHKINILLINDSGAGDFIVTSGAIREIRRIYPDANITLLAQSNFGDLPELCPYVDEVIIRSLNYNYNDFSSFFVWNIEFVPQLLERKFDICFNFCHGMSTVFLSYMSGANLRIAGEPVVDSFFKTATDTFTNLIVPLDQFGTHIVDVRFSLIDNILHAPVANREIEVWYSPFDSVKAKEIMKNISEKIYALFMGASSLKRHYPPELYAKAVERILDEDSNARFVVLGGGRNDLISFEIFKHNLNEKYHKNILDMVGKISFRMSAPILKLCTMYIGNDSGTIHIAAAVKCPALMINCFPMDIPCNQFDDIPNLYHPYHVPTVIVRPKHALPECATTDPNHDQYGCKSSVPHCITQITPDTIFKGFKMLQQRIVEKNNEPIFIC